MFLCLGGNKSGSWGAPAETFCRTLSLLQASGVAVDKVSDLYRTRPVGSIWQPDFINAVVRVTPNRSPATLLRLLKTIERAAGRGLGRHWGPRSLDIDIIDFAGLRLGWPAHRRRRNILQLPHPEAHRRAFVMVPLCSIAPQWHHPGLRVSATRLVSTLGPARRGVVWHGAFSIGP